MTFEKSVQRLASPSLFSCIFPYPVPLSPSLPLSLAPSLFLPLPSQGRRKRRMSASTAIFWGFGKTTRLHSYPNSLRDCLFCGFG
ncbi:unnamed protein product, partial [Rangifer tarandus platyrhynchus]